MAFAVIAGFDILWLIILLPFVFMGKFGNPPPGTGDDEDQELLDKYGPETPSIVPDDINKDIEFEEKN